LRPRPAADSGAAVAAPLYPAGDLVGVGGDRAALDRLGGRHTSVEGGVVGVGDLEDGDLYASQ